MQQPLELASTTHIVGHLLREIESALCAVLDPDPVCADEEDGHKKKIRRILAAIDIDQSEEVAEIWLRLASKSGEYKLTRLAHRNDLYEARPVTDAFRKFWFQVTHLFDRVLTRFEAKYLDIVIKQKLDALLEVDAPTRANARSLSGTVPNSRPTLGYFFDQLDTPVWLRPLQMEGFYSRPPAPFRDPESNTTFTPPWPQMRYLRRMTELEPESVVDIAESIPLTDNARINADILEIGLTVLPSLAGRLVKHVKHGVMSPFSNILFTHKLGQFLKHLSSVPGNCDAALDLAQTIFEILPDADDTAGEQQHRSLSRIRTRLEFYWYERILNESVVSLASRCGLPMLELLSGLLQDAVSKRNSNPDTENRDDWSNHWCESVACPSSRHDIRNVLIAGVVSTSKTLMSENITTIGDVVSVLKSRRWAVFDRISLRLLVENPDRKLATDRLLNRLYFDSKTMRREYASLLEHAFGLLEPDEQRTILDWIAEEQDVVAYCDRVEFLSGKRPAEADARDFAALCIRDRLHPIREFLTPDWREEYEKLVQRFGVLQDRPAIEMGAFAAEESPITLEQMSAMQLNEIVAYIRDWRPKQDEFFGPSIDGLARVFQSAVAKDPNRFVEALREFEGLDLIYISALLSGLKEATKKSWNTDWWRPILGFGDLMVRNATPPSAGGTYVLSHKHILRSLTSLLSAGLEESDAEIPIALRQVVWETLRPLTEFPDPPISRDEQDDDANLDPLIRSDNSVRGLALQAVMDYALWILRDANKCSIGRCTGLCVLPEIREVLDEHVSLEHDPVPAIRSFYGLRFPRLSVLDETWARGNVNAIFPCDPGLTHLWDAAWLPYIVFSRPYDSVFLLLRQQYEHAVRDLQREVPYKVAGNADHREQLAEHLMVFYGRGLLTFDDDDGLLDLFFNTAPNDVRYHAMAFIGQSLQGDTPPPQEVVDRFKNLWAYRVHAIAGVLAQSKRRELGTFGWWFYSDKFDRRWALQQLIRSISLAGWVEPDHEVVRHAANLAPEAPFETVAILVELFESVPESWVGAPWEESAMAILGNALANGSDQTKSNATSLINRLAANGIHQYGKLLD